VLAAADVLFDPPLLLSQHVLGLLLPVPVGRPTRLHGVRTAFKETGHPGGQEFLVGVGGDVVSGVGAVVVVGDDAAQQRGGLTAGAAARDVHPRLGSLCSWSPSPAIRSYRASRVRKALGEDCGEVRRTARLGDKRLDDAADQRVRQHCDRVVGKGET
jgi:hypothetical protein